MKTRTSFVVAVVVPLVSLVGCDVIWGLQRADLLQSSTGTTTTASTAGTGGGTSTTSTTSTMGTTGGAGGGPTGVTEWGESFDESVVDFAPSPSGIAVDSNSNVIVTGAYLGKITFSQAAGGAFSSKGSCSYFLASFGKNGGYNWGTSIDAVGVNGAQCAPPSSSVAVDAQGNVYFAAAMGAGSVAIGGDTYTNPSTMGAVLVASFNGMGGARWVQTFGSASGSAAPTSIAVDSEANVAVTGYFTGSLAFDPQPALTAAMGQPMFLAELEGASGSGEWSVSYGDVASQMPGSQTPYALAVDATGIFVTGTFGPSIQLGSSSLLAVGTSDIFVARVEGEGTVHWANSYGGPGSDVGTAVAVDPAGNVLLFGELGATTSLGGNEIPVQATGTARDGFVAKYDGTGQYQWATGFGGMLGVVLTQAGVAADPSGNVVVAGAALGPVSFGGASVTPAGSMSNVYVGKLNGSGAQDWLRMFGDASGQVSPVVAVNPTDSSVVMAFGNNGTVNLGSITLMAKPMETSLVVARFQP